MMFDMFTGPTPPTATQMAFLDASVWGVTPHQNGCVRLRDGRATIHVTGLPRYVLYYTSPGIDVDGREDRDELPGLLELTERAHASDEHPGRMPGTVCLGIEETGVPSGEIPYPDLTE